MAELLTTPYSGLPPVIDSEEEFVAALESLRKGSGAFAVDAERASGYRYSARAYLIQIKRKDGGLHLIDPIPFGPGHHLFLELNDLWKDDEVILHASTQDLPCLRELGLNPSHLFDTELAGRLLGLPRVGLGALVESLLDVGLAKEHSAQDWSIRPLPEDWLNYAALDVELLIELKEEIEKLLIEAKKMEWARQEFASILIAPPSPPRVDPWRRTSGSHKVKKRHQLAVVRELWLVRDRLAREADISQGRLLTDAAITALALASESAPLTNKKQLEKALRPIGLRARWMEHASEWVAAISAAIALPEDQTPPMKIKSDALPPVKIWRDRFPERYAPLSHARHRAQEAAAELSIPVENLMTPEFIRRICWNLPQGRHEQSEIEALLAEWGARAWQIQILAPILQGALLESEPLPEPETPGSSEEIGES